MFILSDSHTDVVEQQLMIRDHTPRSHYREDGGHGWRETRAETLILDHQEQLLKLKMIEEVFT